MKEVRERFGYYVIGGSVGGLIGLVLFWVLRSMIQNTGIVFIALIAALVGLLALIVMVEYLKEHALRKNNKIREKAVALITHEMRTGLTSTGWAIQLVLEKYADKLTLEDKQLLEGVIKSIHSTVVHSVNLLDASLFDMGKLSISLELISLTTIEVMIKEIIEKYTVGTIKKGITLTSTINLNPANYIEVDMMRLRIIVENLLENAIQYTLLDKKEITVSILSTEKTLNITIADTGIGIPSGEKEKIFEEFFRAQNARKRLSSGSGIGLYMCLQYVKAQHGSIRFESVENVGTTFYVSLPIKNQSDTISKNI